MRQYGCGYPQVLRLVSAGALMLGGLLLGGSLSGCNKPSQPALQSSVSPSNKAEPPASTNNAAGPNAAGPNAAGPNAAGPSAKSASPAESAGPQQSSDAFFAKLVSKPLSDGFVIYDDGDLRDSSLPIEALLVPAKHAAPFYQQLAKSTFWTPTPAALRKMGQVRAAAIKAKPQIGKHHHRYQIVGVERDNARLLFVNAFCGEFPEWQAQPIFVRDGGSCFYNLHFDPATGAISQLVVGG